ncbi:hypothetical protein [Chryseobacterium sp. 2R14A]|uniref:hypothetical protein n=1 Tax=Chryseobacterium sp. 2R14A TaxID=3380353 RepID=UPI003CF825CC
MEITADLKNEFLTNSKAIEKVEVLYKKKQKFSGDLQMVRENPFEIRIFDQDQDEDEAEHFVFFGRAVEITLNYFDGTVKVFKDLV